MQSDEQDELYWYCAGCGQRQSVMDIHWTYEQKFYCSDKCVKNRHRV